MSMGLSPSDRRSADYVKARGSKNPYCTEWSVPYIQPETTCGSDCGSSCDLLLVLPLLSELSRIMITRMLVATGGRSPILFAVPSVPENGTSSPCEIGFAPSLRPRERTSTPPLCLFRFGIFYPKPYYSKYCNSWDVLSFVCRSTFTWPASGRGSPIIIGHDSESRSLSP